MDNTPAFHPLDYLSVLQRRKWWLIVPSVLAIVVAIALVVGLPRTYKADATMGMALPAMSQDLVAGQRASTAERLRAIQQILFSAPVLERVAREEGLDRDRPLSEAASHLRGQVVAEVGRPNPALPPGTLEHFAITYYAADPQTAQRVTNRLADAFVEESGRRRGVRAQETSAFINTQLQASQARLDALEARLAEAKEAYMGSLPEQTGANMAMMTALQQQLETTANAIRGEQDRLSIIERQIEAMQDGPRVETVPGQPAVAAGPAVRVAQLEAELVQLRIRYRDTHPEVVRAQHQLDEARAAAEASPVETPPARVAASLAGDRGYQTLLQSQQNAQLNLRNLQREDQRIRAQIESYRERVEMAPRVEQQMVTLQREYELERDQYTQLAGRLRTAQMDEGLVAHNGADQFTVLNYAALPVTPVSPNVPRLLLVTVLFGICIGGGLALGREYLDRSIHDTRALGDIDTPVLGEIPHIARS
jgi:polysaccharide biosynthesis transport protein